MKNTIQKNIMSRVINTKNLVMTVRKNALYR